MLLLWQGWSKAHALKQCWQWLTDEHVIFTSSTVHRHFARCLGCGRIYCHYWGCVTAVDRAKGRRVGCKCGCLHMRISQVPFLVQAWFVLSRYVWRKLIKKETFWDPRIAAYVGPGGSSEV